MNATEIRAVLNAEIARLFAEGAKTVAEGLEEYAVTATDDELVRFRTLIVGSEPIDFWQPTLDPSLNPPA